MIFTSSISNRISESWDAEDIFHVYSIYSFSSDYRATVNIFVNIISPKALMQNLSNSSEGEFGRGYFIMNDYNDPAIEKALYKFINNSGKSTIGEVILYANKYFDAD